MAFRLFFETLPTCALLVLTVWLPGNLLVASLGEPDPKNLLGSPQFLVAGTFGAIFGPLYQGAIVWVMAGHLAGRRVGYLEAFRLAFPRWGPLFLARLVTGLLIAAGLFALIVPGVYLAIRFALIDPLVVLDRQPQGQARNQSARIVHGKGWEILLGLLCFYLPFLMLSTILQTTMLLVPEAYRPWAEIAPNCLIDVLTGWIGAFLMLYYWEDSPWPAESLFPDPAESIATG
jgi:hypothetical protein